MEENFLDTFEQSQIQEWKDFYIDYKKLKSIITYITKNVQLEKTKAIMSDWSPRSYTMSKRDETLIRRDSNEEQMYDEFKNFFIRELSKVTIFYVENINYYRSLLIKFSDQLNYLRYKEPKLPNSESHADKLEVALKELYKELHMMQGFIELNFKAEEKIIKKFKKYLKERTDRTGVDIVCNEIKQHSLEFVKSDSSLIKLMQEIEKSFVMYFFNKYKLDCIKVLKNYLNTRTLTTKQGFVFGLFTGILLVIIIICFLIASYYNIDMDYDPNFKTIFPMFRGFICVCLFLWVFSINTYIWKIYRINWRLCFKFQNHYSEVVDQLKRAAFFTMVCFLMLLLYLVMRMELAVEISVFYVIPRQMTPLICWLTFFVYLFFPKGYFNWKGRYWFFKNFYEGCLLECDIGHSLCVGYLCSMAGPLRDMFYMFCYYMHYGEAIEELGKSCSLQSPITLIMSLIPFFFRGLQLLKMWIADRTFMPNGFNAVRFIVIYVSCFTSYISDGDSSYFAIWFFWATICSIMGVYNDTKIDFGFLDWNSQNAPLRDKLIYNSKAFYWTCVVVNFIFRFFYVFAIAPDIVYSFIRPEFFSLVIYMGEIIRIGFYNFIMTEFLYIVVSKDYRATIVIEAPLVKNDLGMYEVKKVSDLKELKQVNERLQKILCPKLINRIKDMSTLEVLTMISGRKGGKTDDFYTNDQD